MIVASWRSIATAAVTLLAASAGADIVAQGDVVLVPSGTQIASPPDALQLLDSSLNPKAQFPSSGDVVASSATRIYVGFIPAFVSGFDLNLQPAPTCAVPLFPVAIASDSSGTLYVLAKDKAENPNWTLFTCGLNASVLRQRSLAQGGTAMDLAPDGCTLRYFTYGQTAVSAYDVCKDAVLPTTTLPEQTIFVRGLTGGGFLTGSGSNLLLYDQDNSLIRAIDLTASDVAFSSDGQFMYLLVGGNLPIQKRRVSDGGVVATAANPFLFHGINQLRVVGEQRPTIAALAGPSIPALSPWSLAALAATLALIGLMRAR